MIHSWPLEVLGCFWKLVSSYEMQMLLSGTKFEIEKSRGMILFWFQFEQKRKMIIYSLLYFLFFFMPYTLVFSWSLVYDWRVHIPMCRKYNIVYFFTVTVQIIYIYFILVLEDKTGY